MTEKQSSDNPNEPLYILQHVEKGRDGTEYRHRYGVIWADTDNPGDIEIDLSGIPVRGRLKGQSMENLKRIREERAQAKSPDNQPDMGQP